jgi:transcriptional regulator with XRE-family HTH domain/tetratricopeptide (TPR) repeat protein
MERAQLSLEWLKSARLDRNWTQEYVAEQVGVDVMTIRRWEQGQNMPRPRQYYQLCKLFQKPLPSGLEKELEDGRDVQPPFIREEGQLPLIDNVADACTKFQASDLTTRLLHILWTWPFRNKNARYHKLQSLIMCEVEQKDNTMHEYAINRRNALRRIAVLPIEVYGLSLVATTPLRSPEELLAQCAAGITACWYLRKGKDLAFANDTVSRYIPTLKQLVTNGKGTQRKDAAELLAQCFLLKAPLAWNLTTANDAIAYAQQAEAWSTITDNRLLQVTALRTEAATFCYANQWEQALQAAEKAKHLLETKEKPTPSQSVEKPIPQLVYSYVYAGLATYRAYDGQEEDALQAIKQAHEAFFERSAAEEVPIWIDHNIGNLLINDGETHMHLGLHKDALISFEQIDTRYSQDTTVSSTGRINALIKQAMAEVDRDDQPRDMEQCIDYWSKGIEGAKVLQSNQHFNEAITAYAAMRAAWPGEQRVKKLKELIVHW